MTGSYPAPVDYYTLPKTPKDNELIADMIDAIEYVHGIVDMGRLNALVREEIKNTPDSPFDDADPFLSVRVGRALYWRYVKYPQKHAYVDYKGLRTAKMNPSL